MSPAMAPASLMPVSLPSSSSSSTPAQATAPGALDATALDPTALDPTALATGPPGDSGAPPGASPPTDAFATVLSDQVARTALAEGPKEASPKTSGRRSDTDAGTSDVGASAPAPAGASVDQAAADAATAALGAGPAAVSPPTRPGTSAKVAVDDASSRTEQDTRSGALAQLATTSPAAAAIRGKLDTRAGHDAKDPQPDTSARKPAAAPAPPSAETVKGSATTGRAAPVAASAAHVVAKATASVSAGAVDGGRGMGPTATMTTVTTRPLATAAPASYGVRLEQAAETVRATIAMAARQGSSSARIQLSPASLGGIQIHLQRTSDGLVARVIAEHPEAAQTLAQNGDDLRRSLQQSGMTLLRLDIESSDRRDPSAQQQPGAGGASSRAVAGAGTNEDDGTLDAVSDATSISAHDLSDSALVNVLA
jgi:flagellar hook-length control protein FliK